MSNQSINSLHFGKYYKGVIYLLIALLVMNIIGIIYFNFVTYQAFFHSDSAAKNLVAEEIIKNGTLFPRDWVYVHDDIFVVFGHLFIIPFLFFVKNGFYLHAISGVISAALLLGGLWCITGVLRLTTFYRLLALCFFSSGISPFLTIENLYGQVAYCVAGYLIFFQLYALFNAYHIFPHTRNHSYLKNVGLFCLIVFLVYLSNPARAFLTYTFPTLCGLGLALLNANRISSEKIRLSIRPARVTLLAVFISLALGVLFHHLLLNNLISIASGTKGIFVSIDDIGKQLGTLFQSLLVLVGAQPPVGISAVSFTGFDHISRLILLIGMPILGCSFLNDKNANTSSTEVRFLAGFFIGSFIPVLYLLIFTNILEGLYTSRYLVPAFITGSLFTIAYLNDKKSHINSIGNCLLLIALLITSLSGYRNFISPLVHKSPDGHLTISAPTSPQMRLAAFLSSKELHYGYASYWHANAITVLSNSDVTIRPVWLSANVPAPRYHHSSKSWYTQTAHSGTTFLALTSEENKNLNLDTLIAYTGNPLSTYSFENYIIYVFDSNFAATIFGWTSAFDKPQTLWYSESTHHQIGKLVAQADQKWMESRKGESGALVFGPYVSIDPGSYTANFEVAGCSSEPQPIMELGHAEVSHNNGSIIAGATPIGMSNAWTTLNIDFVVTPSDGTYEFRIISNGNSCLRTRSVTVKRQ